MLNQIQIIVQFHQSAQYHMIESLCGKSRGLELSAEHSVLDKSAFTSDRQTQTIRLHENDERGKWWTG